MNRADEDALIERLQGRRNVLVYMGYMSARVLRSCPDLKTIAYLFQRPCHPWRP